jgi:hypothetical protein
MGAEKIAGFYDDKVKQACDAFALAKAYDLRSFSLNPGVIWRARRRAKFLAHYVVGKLRRFRDQRVARPQTGRSIPAATNASSPL